MNRKVWVAVLVVGEDNTSVETDERIVELRKRRNKILGGALYFIITASVTVPAVESLMRGEVDLFVILSVISILVGLIYFVGRKYARKKADLRWQRIEERILPGASSLSWSDEKIKAIMKNLGCKKILGPHKIVDLVFTDKRILVVKILSPLENIGAIIHSFPVSRKFWKGEDYSEFAVDKERSEVIRKKYSALTLQQMLEVDSENFEIPYTAITEVKMEPLGMVGYGKMIIKSNSEKKVFHFFEKNTLSEAEKLFRAFVGEQVLRRWVANVK
jgi:hypothetical protein